MNTIGDHLPTATSRTEAGSRPDLAKGSRPKRFQLRLATLFWIAFSLACFFAGRQFDDLMLGPDVHHIRLSKGGTHSVTLAPGSTVPRVMIGESDAVYVVMISRNQIQIVAVNSGTSDVTIWDQEGNTEKYVVTVR